MLPSFIVTGTATVAAGSTAVTGQGTNWSSAVQAGDLFGTHKGRAVRIASVASDTSLILAYPWPDAAQTAAGYEIQITPDTARAQETTRQLLQTLSDGDLLAIAGLTSAADTLAYFTGPGTASLASLTAFARSLLDDPNDATMRATLGVVSEYGINANGSYLRLPDGTQITKGAQTVNGSWAAGVGLVPSIAQPAAFVSQPMTKLDVGFFSGVNGAGSKLYGLKYSFYDTAVAGLGQAILQTGTSPAASNPSFVLGGTTALSYEVDFISLGRWF